MTYANGQIAQVGDVVDLAGQIGTVVCHISDGFYSEGHTEAVWSYLREGVMIDFPAGAGLVYFDTTEDEEDLLLIARQDSN